MIIASVIIIFALLLINIFFIGGFTKFPDGKIVYIKKGQSVRLVSNNLQNEKVIISSTLLTATIIALGGENKVVSGPYYFEKSEGVVEVAERILNGDFDIKPIKITFPEGYSVKQIGNRIKEKIEVFDNEELNQIASTSEGHLFPDTYFFLPDVTPKEVFEIMTDTFDEKISKIKNDIVASGKSLEEILKMASLLEEEVQTFEDKKIVSGILWKRISIGMALQVDATLAYERGKTSAELSIDDLRKNSPYNSYTNRGLPPTPISNPGIESIEAALKPSESKYFYFLTDKESKVHYARTFEEHKQNKEKYLR